MRIINTLIIFTNLILYNKEVITYKIKEYQYRIGSLLYVAIIIRLNIIFAILKLLHFFINPNPIYMQMVNKVINYLLSTYTLGFKFGGGDKLKIITDISFTDNINNQKSSQGYTIRLFKGLII